MAGIFSRIASGELSCHKVAESVDYLAFLDIQPLTKGHTLVIPKKEVDYIFDMEDPLYQGLFLFGKQVAKAIKKTIPCTRIGIAVIGLEVPHAHIHLVPMNDAGDLNFSREKLRPGAEELAATALSIRSNYPVK